MRDCEKSTGGRKEGREGGREGGRTYQASSGSLGDLESEEVGGDGRVSCENGSTEDANLREGGGEGGREQPKEQVSDIL